MQDDYQRKDEASLIQQGYSKSARNTSLSANNSDRNKTEQSNTRQTTRESVSNDANFAESSRMDISADDYYGGQTDIHNYSADSANFDTTTYDLLENQAEHVNGQLFNKNELAKESLVRRMLWGQYEKVNNNIHVDEEGNLDLNDEFE